MQKNITVSKQKKPLRIFRFRSIGYITNLLWLLTMIKKAASLANFEAGNFGRSIKDAIVKAQDEILTGKMKDQFPLRAFRAAPAPLLI